jgi:hypothetical protein
MSAKPKTFYTPCERCGKSFLHKQDAPLICLPCSRPAVGTVYRITNYYTEDFVATCLERGFSSARFRVNAPLFSSLAPGDEIEIVYHSPAKFAIEVGGSHR